MRILFRVDFFLPSGSLAPRIGYVRGWNAGFFSNFLVLFPTFPLFVAIEKVRFLVLGRQDECVGRGGGGNGVTNFTLSAQNEWTTSCKSLTLVTKTSVF